MTAIWQTADDSRHPAARPAATAPVDEGDVRRPRLALRVAVTGPRDPDEEAGLDPVDIDTAVETVLQAIHDAFFAAAGAAIIQQAYGSEPPALRMVGSMASAADRSMARQGAQAGYRLQAVLPYRRRDCEDEVGGEALDEVRRLVDRAAVEDGVVELDGAPDADLRARSQDLAARFLVRNADLMIAVGQGSRIRDDRGGTAALIDYALRYNLPVILIPLEEPQNFRLLTERGAFLLMPPAEGDQVAAIRLQVERLAAPPIDAARGRRKPRLAIAHRRFLREKPARSRGLAKIFSMLQRLLAGADPQTPEIGKEPGSLPLARLSVLCDAIAVRCADWYRSIYVLVYFCSGLSLACAVTALALQASESGRETAHAAEVAAGTGFLGLVLPDAQQVAEGGELVLLVVIGGLVLFEHLCKWHDRWIDTRTLAELSRGSVDLLAVGRTLPIRSLVHAIRRDPGTVKESAWIGWLMSAMLRQVLPGSLRFDRDYLTQVRDRFVLGCLGEQVAYHHKNHHRAGRISKQLAIAGVTLFVVTLVAVMAKLFLGSHTSGGHILGWAAGVMPSLSAAILGLRSQTAFDLLARNSERLTDELTVARDHLLRLPLTGPLASERLGSEILAATLLMTADVENWATVFDLKKTEAS